MKKFLLTLSATLILAGCGGATSQQADTSGQYKTYSNAQHHFSLQYPTDWKMTEPNESSGTLVTFASPETLQAVADEKAGGALEWGPESDVTISFWPTINNPFALGVDLGETSYKNIEEAFADPKVANQKIGETILGGQKAFTVNMGGLIPTYGVMLEREGIYQIAFPRTENESELTDAERQMLSSFTFDR